MLVMSQMSTFSRQLKEAPVSVKAEVFECPAAPGPSKAGASPKDSLSPRTDADATGEMNCSSWVVDSSGFLSPTGPALKEVLDMVDGVGVPNNQPHTTEHVI